MSCSLNCKKCFLIGKCVLRVGAIPMTLTISIKVIGPQSTEPKQRLQTQRRKLDKIKPVSKDREKKKIFLKKKKKKNPKN